MNSFPFSIAELASSSQYVLPLLILLGAGLLLMLLDAFGAAKSLPWVAGAAFLLSAGVAWTQGAPAGRLAFFGMMETGGIAPIVHAFLCLSGLLTLFFLSDYLDRHGRHISDVYALLVFAVLGMNLMANAHDLIMTFIGLETMSMCLYIFAALFKTELKSNEAGLKYFLLGSFASAFLLYGIALIYGITGTTNFSLLASPERMAMIQSQQTVFYAGAGMLLVGLLFKVSAFPFHFWTPDVYEGTPTPLAGFMATGSKMATFVALGTLMHQLNMVQDTKLLSVVGLASLLTMIYGNIVASRQQNIKRMLAYSSIAHSGYVLLGLCASQSGMEAMLFYMFIYTLMNIGAFGMLGMVEHDYPDTELENWRGMGQKAPLFAVTFSLFLFSLAGIPPLAGFMGKYEIFIAAIREGLLLPAIVGILASMVGVYYYLRVIVVMFFSKSGEESALLPSSSRVPLAGAAILVVLVLVLGIFPSLILNPIGQALSGVSQVTAVLP